jgi:hypothetical protein
MATPFVIVEDAVIGEGQGYVDFVVRLNASSANTVTVGYETAAGTAVAGPTGDYLGQSGLLTFSAGETAKTVRVSLVDDTKIESAEGFQLRLSTVTNATLGRSIGTALVLDNDPILITPAVSVNDVVIDEAAREAVFVVTLDRPTASTVSMNFATKNGTALATEDYLSQTGTLIFAPGEVAKTVKVALVDETVGESDETFSLVLSNLKNATSADATGLATIARSDTVVNVTDANATEDQGYVDFTVWLDVPSIATVTVDYVIVDGTASSGVNGDFLSQKGNLSFAPGETVKTVRVFVTGDAELDRIETLQLVLDRPGNASLGRATGTATLIDNKPTVSVTDVAVDETAGTATFTVFLDGPSAGEVRVDYSTFEDTARAGGDFEAAAGTLVFAAGETAKTVTVNLIDDNETEPDESFTLELSNPVGANLLDPVGVGVIAASDADAADLPKISIQTNTEASESQGYAEFVVRLDAPSTKSVTVNYSTVAGSAFSRSDYSSASGALTFAPGETAKTVRVTVLDDSVKEDSESFQVVLSNPSNGELGTTAAGTATILDNEPTVAVRDVVVDESAGSAVFIVTLDRPSNTPVSLLYTTVTDTAGDTDYVPAVDQPLVFAPGETSKTVTIDLVDDNLPETSEGFFLSVENSTGTISAQGTAYIAPSDPYSIVVANPTADEDQGYVDFIVRLFSPRDVPVTVDYQTVSGTAGEGANGDYLGQTGTLLFNPGETVKTVRIAVVNDALPENTENLQLQLSNPVNAALGNDQAKASITDDDTVIPSVSIKDVVIDEAKQEAVFVISLDQPGTGTVSLDYATRDGSALRGTDYTAASGTLTFLPGETGKTVRISLVADAAPEADEEFGLVLSNVAGATLADDLGNAVITESYAQIVTSPALSVADAVADERQGYVDFVVRLDGVSSNTVTVDYTLIDGTATVGLNGDYLNRSGALSFAPGETTKTVRITLVDDIQVESAEKFQLVLSAPTNASLARATATATITDDEPLVAIRDVVVDETAATADFVITLNHAATGVVTLAYQTVAGTATAGSDFVGAGGTLSFFPGEVAKTVKVNLIKGADPNETFGLSLSNVTGARLYDDSGTAFISRSNLPGVNTPVITVEDTITGEEQGYADFIVRLSAPHANTVSVDYATVAGSAAEGSDFIAQTATLRFAPGETVKTVRVLVAADSQGEPRENFQLALSNPVNAALGRSTAVATLGDDRLQGMPAVTISDVVVDETTQEAVFVVSLNLRSTDVVSMDYYTDPGSATAGTDYVTTSGKLIFAPGELVKTVRVPLLDNGTAEPSKTFNLVVANIVGAVVPDPSGTAVIATSDAAPATTPLLSVEDVMVGEGQGYADFIVRLDAPSDSIVSVGYATAKGTANSTSDYTDQAGTLSFAPGETVKTVRIALVDDAVSEATEGLQLRLNNPVKAELGRSAGIATVIDNDGATVQPTLSVTDLVVDEAAQEAIFTVALDRPSDGAVLVNYATQDGAAKADQDYRSVSGLLSFGAGEVAKTVRVPLINDGTSEASEAFQLVLSNGVGATLADSTGTAVIAGSDAPTVANPTVGVEDTVVSEGQGYADFIVRLNGPSASRVSVAYALSAATGSNANFLDQAGTLSFAPGETVKTVRVLVEDNAAAESAEGISIKLGTPTNAVLGRSEAVATILDDDRTTGTPVIAISDPLVDETAREAVFTITLDRPSTGSVTLHYQTGDGTATAGSDYEATSGTLAFAPGETAKTIRVALNDDSLAESGETFHLQLSGATGATLPDTAGTAIIAGNDGPSPVTPSLAVEDATAGEGQGYLDFVVRLNAPGTQTVTVSYATADNTALAGNDFTGQTGTLNFAPGEMIKTVRILLPDDLAAESAETFKLTLANPVNATLGRASGLATLVDNDGPSGTPAVSIGDVTLDEAAGEAVFTLTLDRPSTGPVTLNYQTGGGTATADTDYETASGTLVFAAGETARTVRVALIDDTASEGNETFALTLSNLVGASVGQTTGTATIADNDSGVLSVAHAVVDERNGKAVFTVTLDRASTNPVRVNYATADGSARAGEDYAETQGTLTFAPGETRKTVEVTLHDNTGGNEAPNETFTLQLSAPVSATLAGNATAVIIDTPADPVVIPLVSVEDVVVGEGQGYAEFVIRLSAPSVNKINLGYELAEHIALAGEDFDGSALTGSLSFAPGETVKTLRVALVDDAVPELAESFQLKLDDPTNEDFPQSVNAELGRPVAVATILDNDTATAAPVVSVSDPVVDEAAREAVFTLTLDRASAGPVTLDYATGAAGDTATAGQDYIATQGQLRFAPGELAKTVRVPLLNDLLAEDSERFTLHLSNPAGASAPEPDGTAVIVKSDAAPANTPTIGVEDANFGEAQGFGDFVVRLSAPSANFVSVSYSLSAASAFTPDDYADQTGILSFAPGETVKTVRISIVDDNGPTFDETFQLDLKDPVNGLLGRSTAFATIVNDDGYVGQPALSVSDLVVDEAAQEAVFTLTLTGPATTAVTLDYQTQDGSATAGADYAPLGGHLSFAPGETVKTVRVPLFDDNAAESSETFYLAITNVQGAAQPNPGAPLIFPVASAVIAASDTPVTATPLLYVEDLVIGENQGYADFVVRLNAPSSATVSVTYATLAGTAEDSGAAGDYWGQTGTLSFAPGEIVKTVRISLNDDITAENRESLSLVLSAPANAGLGRAAGLATIIDNDGATVLPAVSVSDLVVDETTREAVFTVRLDRPSAGVVSMYYQTEQVPGGAVADDPATAAVDGDYVGIANGALSFAPGEMVKTVRVALNNDDLTELSEAFNLVLSDITGATLARSTGTAVIAANAETPVATPQVGVENAVVSEAQGYADFLVRLDAPSTVTVRVDYATADGTALADAEGDYLQQTGTLQFAPGETVKTVRVALVDDSAAESAETFQLVLTNPANAVPGQATATARVIDDDAGSGTPQVSVGNVTIDEAGREIAFIITLDRPSTNPITLDYATLDGTAKATAGDFTHSQGSLTFAPGEVAKTVRVALIDDQESESAETFSLALSNLVGASAGQTTGTATIADNDSGVLSVAHAVVDERNGKAVFTVTLDRASTNPVRVNYATADGSARAGEDYAETQGTLTFAPGETRKTVEVTLHDNTGGNEAPNETFTLQLSAPVSATLAGNATAVIIDTPADPVVIPLVSVEDVVVGEGQGYAEFVIRLSAPSVNKINLGYELAEHIALAGEDFDGSALTGSLSFAPGETVKTLRVALVDDAVPELAESFQLKLDDPTNEDFPQSVNAELGRPVAVATILDNDTATAAPVVSVSDPVVDEAAREAVFTLTLDRASAGPVTLDYATGAAGDTATAGQDYIATQGQLRFAPGELAKTVRVPLLNDLLAEDSERFTLHLSNPAGASAPEPDGTAVIVKSDAAPANTPTIGVEDANFGEAQGFGDFVVRLSAPSANFVSVSYSLSAASAFTPDDYADQTGILSFAPGETVKTVRISIVDDNGPTFDETFQLDLKDPVNGLLGRSTAFATIVNDDGYVGQPALSVSDLVVDEAAQEAVFTLTLTGPATTAVTLDYQTQDGSATAGADYAPLGGHLSFAPGETVKTVRVPLFDDGATESSETFHLAISNLAGAAQPNPGGNAPFPVATATIAASNQTPATTPLLYVEDLVIGENQGYADFVVRLDAPGATPVKVNYAIAAGAATAGADGDFYDQKGTLSFAPGETVKTVRISLVDDIAAEPTESFRLVLTAPANAGLGRSSGLATILNDDGATVIPAVSVSDLVVDETAGEAVFIVRLDRPSAGVVSLRYATGAALDTALEGQDYVATQGALSFAPGEMAKQVRVPLLREAGNPAEPGELFTLSLSDITGAELSSDATGTAWIAANGAATVNTPRLGVEDTAVSEAQGYVDFRVRLDAPSTQVVSVDYALSGGTGANANVLPQNGSLSFAPGETVKTVRIAIPDDATADPTEALALKLTNPTNASLGRPEGIATLLDDDVTAGVPALSVADVVVDETAGETRFTVVLDRPSAGVVSVSYATRDGTALAGSDYVAASGTLDFVPGERVQTVRVLVNRDALDEGSETFHLELSNASGATAPDPRGTATLAAQATTPNPARVPTLRVEDAVVDEQQGYADFLVRLDGPGAGTVTVAYATADGSALAGTKGGGDYLAQTGRLTFAPGEIVKTVRVALVDDTAAETRESFQLTLSGSAGATLGRPVGVATVLDNDNAANPAVNPVTPVVSVGDILVDETTGEAVFTITLDRPSTGSVTLDYATLDGTAKAGEDYADTAGTLVFAPGETARTVRIALADDGASETSETFDLKLSNPGGARAADLTGTAVIAGNDATPLTTPSLSVEDTIVGEGQGYADFVVRLNAPGAQAVGVHYALVGGSAGAGTDYTDQTGTLSFAPGELVKTVRVALVDNTADEPGESFQLVLDSPANATLGRPKGLATILDNDGDGGTPTVSVGNVTVDETAGEAVFTVILDRPSSEIVTLDYATADVTAVAGTNGDYLARTGTLGFAPGEVAKTVRVVLLDDNQLEQAETFRLTLSNSVGADLPHPTATATIVANDGAAATPKIRIEDTSLTESQGYAEFTVRLDTPGSDTVRVDYATVPGTAGGSGVDFLDQTGTLSFAPGETVKTIRIAVTDDGLNEPDEKFQVVLSNPVHAALEQATGTATILAAATPPSVSVGDAAVDEGAGFATFTVTLDHQSLDEVKVDFKTQSGTATAGADFTAVNGTLTFPAGQTTATIQVPILNDTANEGTEQFDVVLSNPVAAVLGDATGTATLAASDTQAPIAGDDFAVVAEEGTVKINVLANDSDPDGHALSVVRVATAPARGTATIGSDGLITYAPSPDYSGTDSFTYTVQDPNGNTDTATVAVIIDPANDAPTLANPIPDQTARANQPLPYYLVPADTFADPDVGDLLTLEYTARQSNGSALPLWLSFDPATRTFSGTPGNGDVGALEIKVTATDKGHLSAFDTFTLTVLADTASPLSTGPTVSAPVSETSAPFNQAPTTADRAANVAQSGTYTFTAADFPFSDPDAGNSLQKVRIENLPAEGRLLLSGQAVQSGLAVTRADIDAGHLSYQAPAAVQSLAQSFDFRVGDGTTLSVQAARFTFSLPAPTVEMPTPQDAPRALKGTKKANTLLGGSGDDVLDGKGGNDRLSGEGGDDTLKGGTGNDHLSGGGGDDQLYGQNGRDTLIGDVGDDLLNGGAGKDIYRYLAQQLGLGDLGAGDHDTIQATKGDRIVFDDAVWAAFRNDGAALDTLDGQRLAQAIDADTNIAFDGDAIRIDLNGDGQFDATEDMTVELLGQASRVGIDADGFLLIG